MPIFNSNKDRISFFKEWDYEINKNRLLEIKNAELQTKIDTLEQIYNEGVFMSKEVYAHHIDVASKFSVLEEECERLNRENVSLVKMLEELMKKYETVAGCAAIVDERG